ncbi:hypothetical protein [Pseudomonas sp. D4-18]|uniref:hypothetical protein n=1 Tax=Pseudomonas sp. D4-18 TaxID=2817395 RepID=UPI003DA81C14
MPWYKAGTVSVTLNSNAVVGTNTAFIVNTRVGDAFRGPDGLWYEVTNVASNTAIAIDPPYQGPTAAAGAYALAPMQGYVKDSADQLRAIVNTYGAKLAALGTTGNYDILPVSKGGTGITDLSVFMQGMLNDPDAAAARSTMIAAKSGANSDITSLGGLTTPLNAAQGGTGSTSLAGLAVALGLKSAAYAQLIGSVSSGSVFETGTNANGTYVRMADGTQFCYGRVTRSCAVTTGNGSLFYGYGSSIGFPAVFISNPMFLCQSYSAGVLTWDGSGGATPTTCTPMMWASSSIAARDYVCFYYALGKWQ